MRKILTGIAVVASGFAFAITVTAHAQATQMLPSSEQPHAFNKRSKVLQMNSQALEHEIDRFPLMLLPQPTKNEQQSKYAIG